MRCTNVSVCFRAKTANRVRALLRLDESMSKKRRINHDGMVHVIGRSVHDNKLFSTDSYASLFWNEVGLRSVEFDIRIVALCLLGTHYHMLAFGSAKGLWETLHRAHSKLANVLNLKEERRGALIGRRYNAIGINDEAHAMNAIRYVPMNPVHHRLHTDPAKWRWSTHRILVGVEQAPAWFDSNAALRSFGFADSESYNRFVVGGTHLEPPPMTPSDLLRHRARGLALYGIKTKGIAENLGISERHVRRLMLGSAVEREGL